MWRTRQRAVHVRDLRVKGRRSAVELRVRARGPLDLELWDAEREAPLFQKVFSRRLAVAAGRGAA